MQSRGAAVIDVDASGDGLDDWARYPPTEIIPPGDAVAFSQFSSGTAARLRKLAVYRRWRDGDHVVERVPDDLVVTVIALGRLRVIAKDQRGEEAFVGCLSAGGVHGLASALTETPWPTVGVADGYCETFQIDALALKELARTDAALAMEVSCILGRQALELMALSIAKLENLLVDRVHAVLVHFAGAIGRPAGPGARILDLSQNDLASAVGASRARVNVELKALEKAGRVALGYRRMVIYERAAQDVEG